MKCTKEEKRKKTGCRIDYLKPDKRIMAQFICPSCGSEYFVTSKTGAKTIFKVVAERKVQCVQSSADSLDAADIVSQKIYCGACSWQGRLEEMVESHRD